MNRDSENSAFWQPYYESQELPWDLEQAAPPFVQLLSQKTLPPGKLAVLGCGRGHDAAAFADAGFDVTGFDYTEGAITQAKERYGNKVTFVQANIFSLSDHDHQAFDYVLEHTCFCAIPPQQRQAYVHVAHWLLKQHGKFIGLFWTHGKEGGPPFTTDQAEIHQLFDPCFSFSSFGITPDSVESRKGKEYLAIFQKK